MNRNSFKLLAVLPALLLMTAALSARVAFLPPAPVPERVALADVVVIGKVGKVEDKNVSAIPSAGTKDKVEWQVVAFQVEENILGKKETKEIRVGFLPPPLAGGGRPRPGVGVVLSTGQELGLFLTKHPEENFYMATMNYQVIDRKAVNAEKELTVVRRCVKLLADPMAGLKSKEAEDRLLTATMLLGRYRNDAAGTGKTEMVDDAESQLILEALAEADWTPNKLNPALFNFQTSPIAMFNRLGLTEKDGWTPPMNVPDIAVAAKKWIKDNAGTYRIQKFVKPSDK